MQRPITTSFDYRGTLRAIETAELRARVPGYLAEVNFLDGGTVEEGQILFRIEQEPYRIALQEAEARLVEAEARVRLAEAQLARTARMRKSETVSEMKLIEDQTARDGAVAAVTAAKAAADKARLEFSYTEVRAPFAGRISESFVDVGNLVGAGEPTLLATVVKTEPIHAYFDSREDIALRYFSRGRRGNIPKEGGRPAYLGLADEEGFPHEGRVDYVGNTLDPETGTLQIRAIFPNPTGKLFPGLFARIRVPFEDVSEALLVEEDAVLMDLTGPHVLVVDASNVVSRRPLTLGDRHDGYRHVIEGLDADERYVTRGLQKARPGQTVEVVESGPVDGR